MRIGILVPSIGAFGQKGFYNAQEIGLAKALGKLCDEVIVYRLVDASHEAWTEHLQDCGKTQVCFIPAKQIGNNGLLDTKHLDTTLDVLVFFSDTQFSVPWVFQWARKHGVTLLPYIGVVQSHSTNRVKKAIVDLLFGRNLAIYRKCHCLVKTPAVEAALRGKGVEKITVAPVGLDLALMQQGTKDAPSLELKKKYGYQKDDKVLLFVGRLIEEKQPLRMIRILAEARKQDAQYKLLMVGTGELKNAVLEKIEKWDLSDHIQMIERIPNQDIWELYCIADSFVNLNQQEIFGMAILEAMYYGCKVVAWKAPGPSFIIEDGVSGCLADRDEGILSAMMDRAIAPEKAHERIVNHFTWEHTASEILRIVSNN